MRVVVHITPGPQWIPGKPVHEQGRPAEGHVAAMQSHFDAGFLLLGGPFRRGSGIAVLEVADLDAARTLMDADPGVVAGVITYTLDELHAVFDAFSGAGSASVSGAAG
jgi:uncharacterized protein YciI